MMCKRFFSRVRTVNQTSPTPCSIRGADPVRIGMPSSGMAGSGAAARAESREPPMFFRTARKIAIASVMASLAGPGCVPVQNQPTPRPQVSSSQSPPPNPSSGQVASDLGSAGPRIFDDFSRATDPCAAQLQDLCEALLMYYAVKRQLPPSLEELARYMSGSGAALRARG